MNDLPDIARCVISLFFIIHENKIKSNQPNETIHQDEEYRLDKTSHTATSSKLSIKCTAKNLRNGTVKEFVSHQVQTLGDYKNSIGLQLKTRFSKIQRQNIFDYKIWPFIFVSSESFSLLQTYHMLKLRTKYDHRHTVYRLTCCITVYLWSLILSCPSNIKSKVYLCCSFSINILSISRDSVRTSEISSNLANS